MANFRGWSLHANHFLHKLSFHLHSKHMRKLLSPSPFSRRGNEGMKPLPNTGTCIWIKSDLTPECMLGTTHSTAYMPRAFQTALLVFTITSPDSTSPILSKKLRPRELNCLAKGSLVAQTVKCLPAMRETWVWSLGREDLQEKEMATHASTLAWKIPWREEPGRPQSKGLQRVEHDWGTS